MSRRVYGGSRGDQLVDWLYARLASDQTSGLDVGDRVAFDATASSGSSISLVAAGRFSLAAGKRYQITTYLRFNINEGVVTVRWHDNTAAAWLVDDAGELSPAVTLSDNVLTDECEMPGSVVLFTPAVPTEIEMRIATDTGEPSTTAIIKKDCNAFFQVMP